MKSEPNRYIEMQSDFIDEFCAAWIRRHGDVDPEKVRLCIQHVVVDGYMTTNYWLERRP